MKIEWLDADVPLVESPARAERDILGNILGVLWPIQDAFVIREPLCDVEIPS